jgi:hypothetical protein
VFLQLKIGPSYRKLGNYDGTLQWLSLQVSNF